MRVYIRIIILTIAAALILCIPSFGYDIGKASDYLPDTVALDPETDITLEYLISEISGIILSLIAPVLKNFSLILGITVLSAAFSAVKDTSGSEAVIKIFNYVTVLCTAFALYSITASLWESARAALAQLNVIMNSMLPVMSTIYALGGNVTTALISNTGLMLSLTFMENICCCGLDPIMRICFGISLVSGISDGVNLSGLSSFIRNTFTTALAFIMTVMTTVLSYQTSLSLSADNMAARGIKFAAGSAIPIVGSAVGEAVRTIGGSIAFLKNTVGVTVIFAIMLLILPSLLTLIMNKLSISFAAVMAKILSCDKIAGLLSEVQGLLNFSIAILASCSMFFIFTLTLFIKSAAAIS